MVDPIPAGIDTVPSMMTEGERRLLYNLADRHWSGKGLIVDAGILCGASTVLFGRAVQRRSERRRKVIVSIERGLASPGSAKFIRAHVAGATVRTGESFAHIVERLTADVHDVVDLRIGDILDVKDVSRPVEILFLDVLKAHEVADFCTTTFFPRLYAGSFVIQQDYFIDSLPWIREQQEYLCGKNFFDYIGEVGPTAVFRCRKRPAPELCAEAAAARPYEESIRLLSAAEQRSHDPHRRLLCGLARVWRAAQWRGREEASVALLGLRQSYAALIDTTRARRIHSALSAAAFLCENDWNEDVEAKAALMSVGNEALASDEDPVT